MTLDGYDEALAALESLTDKEAQRLLRNTNATLMRGLAKDIRKSAPKGRKGRLKKAKNIYARDKKSGQKDHKVVADVRASKDAFFWRFVEHGQGYGHAKPYVQPAVDRLEARLKDEFEAQFLKKMVKRAQRKMK